MAKRLRLFPWLVLLSASVLALAGCNPDRPPLGVGAVTTTPVAASHGSGPAQDLVSLVDALRARGLSVTPSGTVSQPFLTAPGFTQNVNGETIQIFEYPTAAGAENEARPIGPAGEIPGVAVDWVAQPHFYRAGRVIVIYPGTDPTVLAALESALGAPFATGPGR